MAEKTQLILVDYGELDIINDIPLVLNFSLADIQDVSKRNSAFSKTITLAGTKRNMEILSHLYNVNIEFDTATFPIDRKIPAYILQNGLVVLQGFFKLQSVKKLSPSDISYDEKIEFEAVVFGGQGSFYDYIKDHYLNEIDLSVYNHILNIDNILYSSAYTYTEGFKYIYHYNTAPQYNVSDFRPSIYVRTIWDKIFIAAGYSYEMEPEFQSEVFNKLLLPFNAKDLKITYEQQLERSAKIGLANGVNSIGAPNVYVGLQILQPLTIPMNIVNNTNGLPGSTALYLATEQIEYNNDNDCFFIGALGTYDTSQSYFVCQRNSNYDVDINFRGQLTLDFPVDWWVQPTDFIPGQGYIYVFPSFTTTFNIEKRVAGSSTWSIVGTISETIEYNTLLPYQIIPGVGFGYLAGTYDLEFSIASEPIVIPLAEGDNLRITFRSIVNPSSIIPTPYDGDAQYQVRLYSIGGTFSNSCSESFFRIQAQLANAAEGDVISISQCLPPKTKMGDFVKSISQMFNLYIDVDKDEPTKLYITPRNKYYNYSTSSVIDWTDKFQYDADYSLELLSELQERTINFTFKPSKDVWNESYFRDIKLLYGQYLLSFDNDFLVGEKKIELIFEPTPLVVNMSPSPPVNGRNMIVPALVFGTESNPKILIDGGIIQTDTSFDIRSADGVLHPTQQYNYAGHFDNPYTPTLDINWNVNEKYEYNEVAGNITTNNLYNLYYEDYVNLIQNSKLLTGYFSLNEADISSLRFDVLYWIRDSYWILNKVVDYNINEKGLTKCEFIKTQNIPIFKTTTGQSGSGFGIGPNDLSPRPIKPWLSNGAGLSDDYLDNVQPGITNNVNHGNATQVKGWYNIINVGTTTFSVIGKENVVGQNVEGGSIVGDRNLVGGDSKSINIIGSNNRIGAGSERVCLINCSNIEIPPGTKDVFLQGLSDRIFEKSNVSYVNEFIYFNQGFKVNNSDVVDGGEDIVYTCAPQFVENVLDSGLDEACFVGVDGAQVLDGTYDSPYL